MPMVAWAAEYVNIIRQAQGATGPLLPAVPRERSDRIGVSVDSLGVIRHWIYKIPGEPPHNVITGREIQELTRALPLLPLGLA